MKHPKSVCSEAFKNNTVMVVAAAAVVVMVMKNYHKNMHNNKTARTHYNPASRKKQISHFFYMDTNSHGYIK
jgi:hypothetical protein